MKEYVFRGMDINGNWHYGSLAVLYANVRKLEKGHYISNTIGLPFAFKVRPETVGLATGLTDKNGKPIFEYDILKITHEDGESEIYRVEYMADKWDYPAFDLVPQMNCDANGLSHAIATCEVEVIGNIYQDGDLLAASTKA